MITCEGRTPWKYSIGCKLRAYKIILNDFGQQEERLYRYQTTAQTSLWLR